MNKFIGLLVYVSWNIYLHKIIKYAAQYAQYVYVILQGNSCWNLGCPSKNVRFAAQAQ